MQVDLEQIKARSAEQPARAPAPEQVVRRAMPSELAQQAEQFQRDFAAANAPVVEEKIDLGPLPDAVKKKRPEANLPAVPRSLVEDSKLRDAIEARCAALDLGDLIMAGRVTQVVPVIPGKLTVTFQSLLGRESFWLEKEVGKQGISDYMARNAWLIYARLAMSVSAINGKQFDSTTSEDGAVDDDAFAKKHDKLMKMSERILDTMLANLAWFDARVNKLLEDDFAALKNG